MVPLRTLIVQELGKDTDRRGRIARQVVGKLMPAGTDADVAQELIGLKADATAGNSLPPELEPMRAQIAALDVDGLLAANS